LYYPYFDEESEDSSVV